jgi:hypothetical protein
MSECESRELKDILNDHPLVNQNTALNRTATSTANVRGSRPSDHAQTIEFNGTELVNNVSFHFCFVS